MIFHLQKLPSIGRSCIPVDLPTPILLAANSGADVSACCQWILTGCKDGTARLFNASSGNQHCSWQLGQKVPSGWKRGTRKVHKDSQGITYTEKNTQFGGLNRCRSSTLRNPHRFLSDPVSSCHLFGNMQPVEYQRWLHKPAMTNDIIYRIISL